MTLANTKSAEHYIEALSGHLVQRGPKGKAANAYYVACVVNEAMEAALDVIQTYNLKFPDDDRCMNIEVAIFQEAMAANMKGDA